VVGREQRDVRNRTGERRHVAGAGRWNRTRARQVVEPIRRGHRAPNAAQLLRRRGKSSLIDRRRDQLRAREILELADAAADLTARAALRTLETADLRICPV